VFEAGSVAEARVQLARPDEIGALIVDIGLPDGAGDDLIAELRHICATLPAIIATGYEDPALRLKFAADPYTALVSKPYDPADVVRMLEKIGMPISVRKAS
jgi:DNA-binding NarL/FixJ family response regulator